MKSVCAGIAACVGFAVMAADPIVSNVRTVQRMGTSLLDITYDVADADTPNLTVTVTISTNNGATWFAPASSNLSGAVGYFTVSPGIGKTIVWQGFRELPTLLFPFIKAKITADDMRAPTPVGMVDIPAGTNSGTDPDFGVYSLTVDAFYMDATEVTKAKWDEVYIWAVAHGYSFDNAGSGKAANHPVQTVNWYDCVKWCNARSQKEGKTPCYNLTDWSCDFTANGYRLPTSTEWEYAARGGLSGKRFPWGDIIDHTRANYCGYPLYIPYDQGYEGLDTRYGTGAYPHTSPVGSFAANGYGLYDMAGNVWEWCNDASGSNRYIRGGCSDDGAGYAQCGDSGGWWAYPDNAHISIGVRAVCR